MRWTACTVMQATKKLNSESKRRRNDDAERLLRVEVVPLHPALANLLPPSGDLVLALLGVSAFDLVGTSQQMCLQMNLPSFPHLQRLLTSTFPLMRTLSILPPSLSPQKRTHRLAYSLATLPTLISPYHPPPSLKIQTTRKHNLNPKGTRGVLCPRFFPSLSAQSTRATHSIRTNQYIILVTTLPYGALRRSRGTPRILPHIWGQGGAGHRDIQRKHRYLVLKRSTMIGIWSYGERPCSPPVPPHLTHNRGPSHDRDLLSSQSNHHHPSVV